MTFSILRVRSTNQYAPSTVLKTSCEFCKALTCWFLLHELQHDWMHTLNSSAVHPSQNGCPANTLIVIRQNNLDKCTQGFPSVLWKIVHCHSRWRACVLQVLPAEVQTDLRSVRANQHINHILQFPPPHTIRHSGCFFLWQSFMHDHATIMFYQQAHKWPLWNGPLGCF